MRAKMSQKIFRTFRGRVILAGETRGQAVVTTVGFNTLASFLKSLLFKSRRAMCSDQDNPELYKKELTDKIICLPQTIGSTIGGLAIMTAAAQDIGPRALLFSEPVDSLAASGLILSDVWLGKRIIAIDRLGQDFLRTVKTGSHITITKDGEVKVL